jgi:hypothetical protein
MLLQGANHTVVHIATQVKNLIIISNDRLSISNDLIANDLIAILECSGAWFRLLEWHMAEIR